MDGANSRFPLDTGTRRLYSALSFCVASWNMRVSIAAAEISMDLRGEFTK